MKETKLAAKKQEVGDKINKNRSTTKSKLKIILPPIIDSSSKPIFISPPIIDSSIDKSTVTNLNKNNNNELVNEETVNEDNNNNNVDIDSKESTSDESNDESCGNDKNLKFNDDDDDDDEDSEDDSINRTSSDESIDESRGNDNECNVILPDMMPLTIGTNTVNTQGAASSVHIHDKKYSNETLQKKHCMLKRGSKKGVEIPYLNNDVYLNENNNGYCYDVSTTNELRKIVPDKNIRVTFDHWNLSRPSTCNYVNIFELYPTCVYRKIIYECRSLINICASVTMPNKLSTCLVTHFGKVSGIYFNENEGDLFLVSYNKEQYDIVPEDYLDILFKDYYDELE